jgi:hypothetical protein
MAQNRGKQRSKKVDERTNVSGNSVLKKQWKSLKSSGICDTNRFVIDTNESGRMKKNKEHEKLNYNKKQNAH